MSDWSVNPTTGVAVVGRVGMVGRVEIDGKVGTEGKAPSLFKILSSIKNKLKW